jgi:general secretion pathway protein H
MRISATGSRRQSGFTPLRRSAEHGFTLVELLIVLAIIGMMSAVVVLAIPDPRGSLVQEAERFAARAKAAQERAIMDARATSVRVTNAGYGFDRRERSGWQPIGPDQTWIEGTAAAVTEDGAARIVFDSTGTAEPAQLVLRRQDEQVVVDIRHDGSVHVGA